MTSPMRRVVEVISTSRSDYGHLLPILKAIQADPGIELRFLSPMTGSLEEALARSEIARAAGLEPIIEARVSKTADFLLVLGDRSELLEYVAQVVSTNVAVAHVHGGEETAGAFDNRVRHALTKLSHLHFVAHPDYAERVLQMGEELWRVHVVGAPCLDMLEPFQRKEEPSHIMVVYQPVTLELDELQWQMRELTQALEQFACKKVVIGPNSDPGNTEIDRMWRQWLPVNVPYYNNIPPKQFWDVMAQARVLVGNSSAGMIEAPTFGLPVVNIGTRQDGRIRSANVIDVGYSSNEIRDGVCKALSPEFTKAARAVANPLWRGGAAGRIVEVLKTVELGDTLLRKKFVRL